MRDKTSYDTSVNDVFTKSGEISSDNMLRFWLSALHQKKKASVMIRRETLVKTRWEAIERNTIKQIFPVISQISLCRVFPMSYGQSQCTGTAPLHRGQRCVPWLRMGPRAVTNTTATFYIYSLSSLSAPAEPGLFNTSMNFRPCSVSINQIHRISRRS